MKKILVPYDFSESSDSALNYALGIAEELTAELILLNILPYPVVTPETGLPAFSYQEMLSDNARELNKVVEKVRKQHTRVGAIKCLTEMGDVTENIVDYCKNHPIEFVVMGIYQHGNRLMKSLMGSNAVATAHKTKCTVIIIPPKASYKKPAIMALASDPGSGPNTLIQKAKKIADLFDAELQLLHVIPNDHHFSPAEIVRDTILERPAAKQPHEMFIITEKKVSEGLLSMLDNKLVDMILVEPKEHSLFYRLFHESVSKEIAFASPVPVALIHS